MPPVEKGGEKICGYCGRAFSYHRRWARNWSQVRYCSARCRTHRNRPANQQIEESVIRMLGERNSGASLCPSDPARALWPSDWRVRMPEVHAALRRLALRGEVEWFQGGKRVDPANTRGPFRIRSLTR